MEARMKMRPMRPEDREPLESILTATAAFSPAEIRVAMELIDIGLTRAGQTDYYFQCIEDGAGLLGGYLCYGEVPLSDRCWDLYWIAVDPRTQGQGLGKAMVRYMEADLRERRARKIFIETGGKTSYGPTRAFYEALGYREIARVPGFFAAGDDKVIFGKDLT
jgi:ribosomal protein S18 acetylase RimI-like enzyme